MVQGYYTLEEAADILGMESEKLSQMAQKREIRAFADRGTWRFRTQDIEEKARQMGHGSDPVLQPGDAPPVLKKRTSGVDKRSSKADLAPPSEPPPEMPPIPVDEEDLIGLQPTTDAPFVPEPERPKTGRKRTSKVDVKSGEEDLFEFELSSEASIEMDLDSEMGYQVPEEPKPAAVEESPIAFEQEEPSPRKTSLPAAKGKTGVAGLSSQLRKTKIPPEIKEDSGVKLVGFDETEGSSVISLSDHAIGSDSDVDLQLESGSPPASGADLPMTEEVKIDDLDEELRKAEEASRGPGSSAKVESSDSPFELTESDLEDAPAPRRTTGKSDAPPPDDDDDEVSLGDLSPTAGASGASGINLHMPADTGVNLEKSGKLSGGDEVEFELSLDADSTPAPSSSVGAAESSEFELTLDDAGGLAPLEGEESGSSETESASEEKDIFETDVDMPALDEEGSGSEAVALDDADTDLEKDSSEFDFDPNAVVEDEAGSGGAESGSQVVALDEDEEVSEVEREEEEEGEVEEVEDTRVGAKAAPWGALPAIFLLPSVVVMFLLGLMTFEILHGMWGYKQPYKPTTLILRSVADMFGAELPKDQ